MLTGDCDRPYGKILHIRGLHNAVAAGRNKSLIIGLAYNNAVYIISVVCIGQALCRK